MSSPRPASLSSAASLPLSRRRVAGGLAWSVPAMALTAAAPAFAASRPQCFPVTWTTTGTASTASQSVPVTGTSGGTGTVTVTPSTTAGYSLPGGTTYGPLNLTSTDGSMALSTYVDPRASTTTRSSGYASLSLQFPEGMQGPISFTISGIDSYTTSANGNGAQYFTDQVIVLNEGTPLAPTSTISANHQGGGRVVAAGTASGSATYRIDNVVNPVEIRLSNAFTGSIPLTAHPDQTVTVSAVVCSTTPPEPEQPTPTPTTSLFDSDFYLTLEGNDVNNPWRQDPVYHIQDTVRVYPPSMPVPAPQGWAPDVNWSDATGPSAYDFMNGEGRYTPVGTLGAVSGGAAPARGSGFWISSPLDSSGQPIRGGQTVLKKGAIFQVEFTLTYADQTAANGWLKGPRLLGYRYIPNSKTDPAYDPAWAQYGGLRPTFWGDTPTTSRIRKASSEPARTGINSVETTLQFNSWQATRTSLVHRGTATFTTTADVVVPTASNGTARYGQLQMDTNTIFEADLANQLDNITAVLSVVQGTVEVTANGQTTTVPLGTKAVTNKVWA
ncbi:hypothetical protein [Micrococcus sp.]|uniref:hypothetical protein n=1 Tax=Micrococcus sp. TaxID=1271 RepID=UPI002A914DFF|nr:hypothetical protein [Micrococcus sp.]MDY6055433.1 hypothetical protein [Micrococcus sp.]